MDGEIYSQVTMRSNAYALVVGCDRYDSYPSLRGAEDDAEKIRSLLTDPERGAFTANHVRCIRSPRIEEVQIALNETAAQAAADSRSFLLLYFSGHGVPGGRDGVQIAFRDTHPTKLTFSALSLRQIARLLAEHRPSSSLTILDLCFSGSHTPGAAELALNELWSDEGSLADGHFILASCGPDEVARENLGGGKFTSLLFEQIEKIGQERPFDRDIAIETLANSIVNASQGVLQQKPTWTGIAVSRQISFCSNPYWDSQAVRPPVALSFAAISEEEREPLSAITRSYVSPMVRIGSGKNWSRDAKAVFRAVAGSAVSCESKTLTIGRLIEAIADRVNAFGHIPDVHQLIETLPAAVIALGQCGSLAGAETRMLAYRLAQLTPRFQQFFTQWKTDKGWLLTQDGPAGIALAPIRFWDVLGEAALLALASSVVGMAQQENLLAQQILDLVKSHVPLYRVEWVGQYPDISAVVGYIAWQDQAFAHEIAERLLEQYVKATAQGRLPTPANLPSHEIGKDLAMKYAGPIDRPSRKVEEVDEGLALFFLMLAQTGESPISLNGKVATLLNAQGLGNYYLYVPESIDAQFFPIMSNCKVYEWMRTSQDSAVKMLGDLETVTKKPLPQSLGNSMIDCFATYAAGRLYRNRACYNVFTALAERSKLEGI